MSSPEYLKQELDTILSAFINLGYPAFFIKGVISEAKTKYLVSAPAPRQPTPATGIRMLSFPYHPELRSLNASIRASNHRIVVTSSNNIGRAVVSKRGTQVASAYRSGVNSIDFLASGPQLTYYGKSLDFNSRITTHVRYYRENKASSALVKHVQEFLGYAFNPREARLI